MFIVAVALVAFGYAVFYHGASSMQAYKMVHDEDIDPTTRGGIPLSVLLGLSNGSRGGGRVREALPPIVTSTPHHKAPGQRTPLNKTEPPR